MAQEIIGRQKGQIVLVIDRRDRVCQSLRDEVFKTKKSLATTLVTTYGVKPGKYSYTINSIVTMDDLYIEIK